MDGQRKPTVAPKRRAVRGWFADRRVSTKILIALSAVAVVAVAVNVMTLARLSSFTDEIQKMKSTNLAAQAALTKSGDGLFRV